MSLPDDWDDYRPAWWLPGPHLQALWGVIAQRPVVPFRREALRCPDGDELVLDHVDGIPGSPRMILLHGLEGSSYSGYVQGFASIAMQRGWRVTAVNFRHCARDLEAPDRSIPNLLPRLYHCGDSPDLDLVVRTLLDREPDAPLFAAGASLGGSVLLKYMGETGRRCPLRAAMVVSVPYDLARGEVHLATRMGKVYLDTFLVTLRPKLDGLIARFPELTQRVDPDVLLDARRFRDVDEGLTAPLHGFASADDYYACCSAVGFVSGVRVPTLSLTADDDPFIAPGVLDRVKRLASDEVRVVTTEQGGHVGFVSGTPWNPYYFTEQLFASWFDRWAHALVPEMEDVEAAG